MTHPAHWSTTASNLRYFSCTPTSPQACCSNAGAAVDLEFNSIESPLL